MEPSREGFIIGTLVAQLEDEKTTRLAGGDTLPDETDDCLGGTMTTAVSQSSGLAPTTPATGGRATDALLQLDGVCKSFDGQTQVLNNVDLQIERGDFIALIGPSGCGKSTLLKLVAGLIEPTAGALNFVEEQPPVRDRLAYVFQDATLLPWLSVIDNVAMPLKIAGLERTARLKRAQECIDLVGLSHAADQYPRQLSGGMRMRVSIARALTVEPALLLLDEPFGALDEMTRNTLNEELLRIREQSGWTALFVTHSVVEAVFLASRVVVLAPTPGRIDAVLDIPLAYPRTPATRESEAFGGLVLEVTRALHGVHHG
ncbi:MAG: ABC transporter ATP-binding protein [Pseudomonadota bacterium]